MPKCRWGKWGSLMFTDELKIDKNDRDYEKKIESFGKATIKDVENKSKMFGTTVNQVANVMSVRK